MRGVLAAGVEVGRVEIDPDGTIIVVAADDSPPKEQDALDQWIAGRARSS